MERYLYSELANLVQARRNSLTSFQSTGIDNGWFDRHSQAIERLVYNHMPSGSGFDNGTTLDLDASHADKLVFTTSFHHMEEGSYNGWTEHTVTVTPSFIGRFHLRISGRNRNEIKEAIYFYFEGALSMVMDSAEVANVS